MPKTYAIVGRMPHSRVIGSTMSELVSHARDDLRLDFRAREDTYDAAHLRLYPVM